MFYVKDWRRYMSNVILNNNVCFCRKILKNNDEISTFTTPLYIFLSMDASDDFLPTQLADRFVNIRRLGKGSCGEVRLVKDRVSLLILHLEKYKFVLKINILFSF